MPLLANFKHYLWGALMKRMHLDYHLRSGIQVIVRNYADWCIYNDLFVNGEYDEAIADTLAEWMPSAGRERLCVLDLGANTGYFTLQLADTFLRQCPAGRLAVALVEASSRVAAELKRRLVIPGDRVEAKVVNGLAGKRDGAARLNYGKEDILNFVGETGEAQWDDRRGSATVPYVNLDTLTADMPVVHLIKCDIEGSEFQFLECYPELLAKTRRVALEFHSPFGDIAQATEKLRGLGFTKITTLRESPETPTICFARP
jgi:FkbM family methyltransferase